MKTFIDKDGIYLYSDNLLECSFLEMHNSYQDFATNTTIYIHKIKDDIAAYLIALNDCLCSAEYIMGAIRSIDIENINDVNSLAVYDSVGSLYIGNTKENNRQSVCNVPDEYSNENAVPKIGESFFICCTIENEYNDENKSPYHAAAVVAEDDNNIITIETFANEGKLTFKSYSRSGNSCFHNFWAKSYFNDKSVKTICIKLIDPR